MVKPPGTWRAAVCYDSPSISRVVRETLEGLGWEFERDKGLHHFNKMMVVIAMPQASYVFKYIVKKPVRFSISVYDEKPTHSGVVHYIEVDGITKENAPKVRRFLQGFAGSLPREPYDFFWVERVGLGLIRPEHLTAKRRWASWGI